MATKSKSNKSFLHPLIVSTDCSRLKSFQEACRRNCCNPKSLQTIPSKPTSLKSSDNFRNGEAAMQAYRAKANLLKLEFEELERLIKDEKIRLVDCIADISAMKLGTKETSNSTNERAELIRLANGYLYHIKVIGKPWGRLAIQVSTPAILSSETEPNLSQVLQRMASMGTQNLSKWLLESMPMEDIHGNQIQETEMNTVCKGSGKGFMEAIVMASMEKMEILALEGLRIQMGRKEVTSNNQVVQETSDRKTGESIFVVMLIQMRDPENEYKNVGKFMVGLVGASAVEGEERTGFMIDGVHIAGIANDVNAKKKKKKQSRFMKPIRMDDIKNLKRQRRGEKYLWSMSVKYRDGRCSFRCWDCVRNPDIFFF